MERIGLIAGSGRFPVLFAETARRRGVEVVAVAHRGETDPELERVVHALTWIHPGELQAMIDALHRGNVRRTVMVGGIAKPRLFRELRPDARALAALARLGQLRDDLVLRAVAAELEAEGIAVVESTLFLDAIVPSAGQLSARVPTPAEWDDIRFGFRAAKAIGRFDIGQSVVVRSGAIIAVEGIEGTDATIRRAGQLANGDVVLVKVCKPTQDTRFDLPAVGPTTIDTLAQVRGRALAVEAGRTITLDRADMIARADAAGIAVVAVDAGEVES
jgi:UDP-2,3-diacylglucosamine hydrolase